MIPEKNNIVEFDVLSELDKMLADKIIECANDLEYYESEYTGKRKGLCQKVTLKDFKDWIVDNWIV